MQKRRPDAGKVARVPAPEIEAVVAKALREHFGLDDKGELPKDAGDRHLIEHHVQRIIVKPQAIEIHLRGETDHSKGAATGDVKATSESDPSPLALSAPWSPAAFSDVKGIIHAPAHRPATLNSETRDALLSAIAKARSWIEGLIDGRITSFAEIAKKEGKVERHIRLLCPLAFVSPRIIAAIMDGSAPADLTVTRLAQRLAYSWEEQEPRIYLPKD
jgi:hypothetical protein